MATEREGWGWFLQLPPTRNVEWGPALTQGRLSQNRTCEPQILIQPTDQKQPAVAADSRGVRSYGHSAQGLEANPLKQHSLSSAWCFLLDSATSRTIRPIDTLPAIRRAVHGPCGLAFTAARSTLDILGVSWPRADTGRTVAVGCQNQLAVGCQPNCGSRARHGVPSRLFGNRPQML